MNIQMKMEEGRRKPKEVPAYKDSITVTTFAQLLLLTCPTGGKIFSPFTGPGSLPLAAMLLGCPYYGFVFDNDYLGNLDSLFGKMKDILQNNPSDAFSR